MIAFTTAVSSDREALKALWLEAFPEDSAAETDAFLDTFFDEGRALVARDDGRIVSMLFLLAQQLWHEGQSRTVGYVYAGATATARRGEGLYRQLLGFAAQYAAEQGMAALFLHPADAYLAQSYRRMGFDVPMTCARCVDKTANAGAEPLSPSAYRAHRCRALREAQVAFVDWDEKTLRYAMTWCRALGTKDGAALLGERDGQCFAWECFGALPPEATAGRTVGQEEEVGLMRWLETEPPCLPSIYMGYGLE